MKRIRYSKYVPDPAGEMSMEDLLSALSDYLLQSGFQDSMWYEMPQGEQTIEDLRRAIENALLSGEMFDENLRQQIEQLTMGSLKGRRTPKRETAESNEGDQGGWGSASRRPADTVTKSDAANISLRRAPALHRTE